MNLTSSTRALLAGAALLTAPQAVSRVVPRYETDSLETPRDTGLRVFVDCPRCDQAYIKSEITFVNYVRDRHEAQVHVLVTTRSTGSGGREYTLTFVGQAENAGKEDTLEFMSRQTDTDEIIRSGLVRVMKMGLMRFVAGTPVAREIVISYRPDNPTRPVQDPWDNWVLKTSLRSYLNGEKSHEYAFLSGSISANRVTPDLKLRVSAWGNYTDDRFDIGDAVLRSIARSEGVEGTAIFSLDEHWSLGGTVEAYASTYSNRRLGLQGGAGIEYNIFPYNESTRRQLRFAFQPTWSYQRYEEETIFDKEQEHLLRAELSIALELKEVWGSVAVTVEGSQYVHDLDKHRIQLSVETSLSLVEGLSFDVSGNVSLVHDQLSLAKSSASRDEVLLQRRQLATQYQYYTSVGLSYTFGSIYNNIVNPRFGSY